MLRRRRHLARVARLDDVRGTWSTWLCSLAKGRTGGVQLVRDDAQILGLPATRLYQATQGVAVAVVDGTS